MNREEEIKRAAIDYERLSNRICPDMQSFVDGARWADEYAKSPWISTKEDLPCKHMELIVKKGLMTKRVIVVEGDSLYFDRMLLTNNEWIWVNSICPSYWFVIPELPKE